MEKTIPGTPKENVMVEYMNRTLDESARSMRLHAGLPKTLLSDAASTTAYLINRGPSVPLSNRLPKEVWSAKEVNLSYLRVFGCVFYVYIKSDARSKLDAKSRKCIFYFFLLAREMRSLAIGFRMIKTKKSLKA